MRWNDSKETGRVFVGGPMQYAIHGTDFDDDLKRVILFVIKQLEDAGYGVSSAHLWERFGLDTSLLNPEEVTRRDFGWMRDCDVFVAVLAAEGGGLMRTDGTHVELGWASAQSKPVIILTPEHCVPQLSHLVRGLYQVTSVRLLGLEGILSGRVRLPDVVDELLSRPCEESGQQLVVEQTA